MTASLVSEQALAETFDGGYHHDAWAIVDEYRRATRYASKHNVKSSATARALDLPRGRLRAWIDDGGAPDPVRAIDVARSHGWLDVDAGDSAFDALNVLVANVFSGGSIARENYVPSFALTQLGEDSRVIDALARAGVDHRVIDDRDGRADEVRPTDHATVLGRVLVVLGAPVGPKSEQHLELPAYLDDAPDRVRESFALAYLENRAFERHTSEGLVVSEDRNEGYLRSLAALIEDVADAPAQLSENGTIQISADARRNLGIGVE